MGVEANLEEWRRPRQVGRLDFLRPVGSAIHPEDDANGPLIILWAEARHQSPSSMLSP
jgi:hypothetical protein